MTHILTTVAEDDQRTRNYAQLYVDLTEPGARKASQFDLMDRARHLVGETLPHDLRINIAEVPDFAVGGNLQGVQYIMSGPDYGVLQDGAAHIIEVLKQSGKAVDIDTTSIPGRPEVQVTIDRDRAADWVSTYRTWPARCRCWSPGSKLPPTPSRERNTKCGSEPAKNSVIKPIRWR